jgi:YegS/Rv2252/BmrU family lipid kinase
MGWCEKNNVEFKLLTTTKPGDGTRLGRLLRLDGFERVVVLGGDGTVNEIGQGIVGSEIVMGVLPGGAGNDFFKMLGTIQPKESLKTAFLGNPTNIDVGLINGRPFFNAVGIGFDAEVAVRAAQSRAFSGFFVYLVAVFKAWRKLAPYRLEIELDQLKMAVDVTLLSVGNGRCSGGGFYLTPQATIDDGLLDICLIESLSKSKIFQYLPRTLKGTHVRLPGVRMFRSRKIVVKSADKFPIHIDGEVTEPIDRAEILLDKRKLKVALAGKIQ